MSGEIYDLRAYWRVQPMIVAGTCGHKVVESFDQLQQLLRNSRNGDFGEFWLGEKNGTFPALAIHTHGNLAYVHFFPADRHPGFQSIGEVNSGDEVIFKQAGQGEFSMPRAFVVAIEQAYEAAAEFFTTLQLPSCIQWTEL